jgi:hypothetical protein
MYLQLLDFGEAAICGISHNFLESKLFNRYLSENFVASSVHPLTILNADQEYFLNIPISS